jgi:hypothetical protein
MLALNLVLEIVAIHPNSGGTRGREQVLAFAAQRSDAFGARQAARTVTSG